MERFCHTLEPVRRDVSTAWISSVTLAQDDEPNTHPGFENIQGNQLNLPLSDFPMMSSAWCVFHQISDVRRWAETLFMPSSFSRIFLMGYAYSISYLIYCQFSVIHDNMVNVINVWLGSGSCRMSRPWVIFKTLPFPPQLTCPLL